MLAEFLKRFLIKPTSPWQPAEDHPLNPGEPPEGDPRAGGDERRAGGDRRQSAHRQGSRRVDEALLPEPEAAGKLHQQLPRQAQFPTGYHRVIYV